MLAGLCFLLPFVSLSCASEEAAEGFGTQQEDQELTGVQLVTGGVEREGLGPGGALGPPIWMTFRIFTFLRSRSLRSLSPPLWSDSVSFRARHPNAAAGSEYRRCGGSTVSRATGGKPFAQGAGLKRGDPPLRFLDSSRAVRPGRGSACGSATLQSQVGFEVPQ